MRKKKTDWWGIIFFSIVAVGVVSVIANNVYGILRNYSFDTNYSVSSVAKAGFDFELDPNTYEGECGEEALKAFIDVYVVDSFPTTTESIIEKSGGFYQEKASIVLTGDASANIDTIAHEVSHAVDWILVTKGIRDGETRAYLQGFFTKCVYEKANYHFIPTKK